MFIENKYTKWYFNIVKKNRYFLNGEYFEVHHIIPKSLGGLDDITNKVSLTAREHFICHLLLTKMVSGQDQRKMIHAINLMRRLKKHVYITSKTYEIIKKLCSKTRAPMSEETKKKISEKNKGRKLTPEQIQNRAKNQTGKKHSLETRLKLSGSKSNLHKKHLSKALTGRTLSESHKEKLRRPMKEETKEKISKTKTGVVFSEDHKEKLRVANLGRTHSKETIEKISNSKKGKPMSEEHKEKLRKPKKKKQN